MRDVVVMGGGPAGLALGCYLADAGITPLIIEKLNHPRPHVGESLMPSTVRVIREIGFHPVMEEAGFPHSRGVAYRPIDDDDVLISYAEFPQEGVGQDYTYHVDRARFDMLLMKHAESKGCKIVQGTGVDEVLFDDGGTARGVRMAVGDQTMDVDAKIVVDAAGRATRIGRQLELRRNHPVFDQLALHAWFTDVDRGPEESATHTQIFFLPELRGWAWIAPINDSITSIGVVAARSRYQEAGLDVPGFFDAALASSAKLARATRDARRINDLRGDVNYSYSLDRVCGDGWLAIGDAARFLDPVFSSGVSVAMHTARLAAERIEAALTKDDASREAFRPYEDVVLSGAAIWDDFIRLFYRLLPAFTHLLRSEDYRTPLLRMIQGDVHGPSDPEWLTEMRALVRKVEEVDAHPWKDELVEPPL